MSTRRIISLDGWSSWLLWLLWVWLRLSRGWTEGEGNGDLAIDFLDHGNTGEFLIFNGLKDILDLGLDGIITQFGRVGDECFLAIGTSVSLIDGVMLVFLEVLLTPASSSIGSRDGIVSPTCV